MQQPTAVVRFIAVVCVASALATITPSGVAGAEPVLRLLESPNLVRYQAELGDLGEEGSDQYCWKGCELADEIAEVRLDGAGEQLLLLSASLGDDHSLLLRSVDGGRHWSEPVRVQQGVEIQRIHTLDAKTAWIVLGWTIESTGDDDPALRTDDGGVTWQRVGAVHKPHSYSSWVESLDFVDVDRGRCVVTYDDLGSTGDGFLEAVLTTADGGRTWHEESRGHALQVSGSQKQAAGNQEEVVARDGTHGRIATRANRDSRLSIRIERRRDTTDRWETRSVLPSRFAYDRGRLRIH